jgi:hypothetical protein
LLLRCANYWPNCAIRSDDRQGHWHKCLVLKDQNLATKVRGFHMWNYHAMKKLALFAALTVALYAVPTVPVYADASANGCEHSDGKAKGCSDTATVPEPNIGVLVATGLLAAAGLAFMINRKRIAQN